MHRPTLGVIALVLLVAGGAGQIWLYFGAGAQQDAGTQQIVGAFVRVGVVLGVLWLALPQTRTLPRFFLITIVVTAVVLAWKPKVFLVLLGFMLVFALLRPRIKGRPTGTLQRGARKTDPTKNVPQ